MDLAVRLSKKALHDHVKLRSVVAFPLSNRELTARIPSVQSEEEVVLAMDKIRFVHVFPKVGTLALLLLRW